MEMTDNDHRDYINNDDEISKESIGRKHKCECIRVDTFNLSQPMPIHHSQMNLLWPANLLAHDLQTLHPLYQPANGMLCRIS